MKQIHLPFSDEVRSPSALRAPKRTIRAEGLAKYTGRVTLPYRTLAASHFDPMVLTYTERLLRRFGVK